jgi:ribulose-5-phosphate 4-epimerase/fuculose-1-phosphate aldolase
MFHNAAFLGAGVPAWEIRKGLWRDRHAGRRCRAGKSLAQMLADKSVVVLIRGHGDVTVGPAVKVAVFRADYTDINARLQSQATALGGDINFLTVEEGAKADAVNLAVLDRVWNLWKLRVAPGLPK